MLVVSFSHARRNSSQMVRRGYSGSYTADPNSTSNTFYDVLYNVQTKSSRRQRVRVASSIKSLQNPGIYVVLAINLTSTMRGHVFRAQVVSCEKNNKLFLDEFASGMDYAHRNADLFDEPLDIVCGYNVRGNRKQLLGIP